MNKETEFQIVQEASLALVPERRDEYKEMVNEMIEERGAEHVQDLLVTLILEKLGPGTGLFLHRDDGNVRVAFDTAEGNFGMGIMLETEELREQNIPHGAFVTLGDR